MINDYLSFDGKTFNLISSNYKVLVEVAYDKIYGDWKKGFLCSIKPNRSCYFEYINHINSCFPIIQNDKVIYFVNEKSTPIYEALKKSDYHKVINIIKNTQFISVKAFAEKYGIDYKIAIKEVHSLWYITTGKAVCYPIPVLMADTIANWMRFKPEKNISWKYRNNTHNVNNLTFFDAIISTYKIAFEWAVIICNTKGELYNNFSELAEYEVKMNNLMRIWKTRTFKGFTDPNNIL